MATPRKISVKVTPKARQARVVEDKAEDGTALYRVYVHEVAENGKANAAVIALLAKHFDLRKSSLRILRGETSRTKIIEIDL